MKRLARQRGVALLIALLVVALATVLIAGLLDRAELSLARTRNALRAEQADEYALGMEAYAVRVLQRDAEEGSPFDARGDMWSIPLPPTPVPGGTISASMTDLNGCFNLNNLMPDAPLHGLWKTRFTRLLQVLRIDVTLVATIEDWLDANQQPSDGGAEDNAYLALDPPYRTANRTFAHVSELRLLRGVTSETYAALAPHVCALPIGSQLNLNTADVEVLRSLDVNITEEMAKRLWSDGRARYTDINQALAQFGEEHPPATERAGLVVTSRYFLARSFIVLDGLPFTRLSVLDRGGSGSRPQVLTRSAGAD